MKTKRRLSDREKGWNAALRKAAKIVGVCKPDHEEGGKRCACSERILAQQIRR